MYRYATMEKKLSTPKKAWKRLISSIQSKLLYFSKSNALTKTNHNRLSPRNNAFSLHPNIYHHYHHYPYHRRRLENEKQRAKKSIPSVNNKMDKLYLEPAASMDVNHLCPDVERDQVSAPNETASEPNNVLMTRLANLTVQQPEQQHVIEMKNVEKVAEAVVENGHEAVVSSIESAFMSLPLHGVDAKAEEFIQRNKEAWRLERQKSVEEYFAMLARGA